MEQYFHVVHAEEGTMVITASMYLTNEAKLWWRTKYSVIQAGEVTINTWKDMKRELCAQFFPDNVEYRARRNLIDLKQTGNIREYVKKFLALMLAISDMFEKDKVFAFLDGLKPCGRTSCNTLICRPLSVA